MLRGELALGVPFAAVAADNRAMMLVFGPARPEHLVKKTAMRLAF
jgi:hypothetical protein